MRASRARGKLSLTLASRPRSTCARTVTLHSIQPRPLRSLIQWEAPFALAAQRYPYRGQGRDLDDYEKLDVEETYLQRGATILRLPMVHGEHDRQRREEFVLRRVRAGRRRIPFGAGTWLTCRCRFQRTREYWRAWRPSQLVSSV